MPPRSRCLAAALVALALCHLAGARPIERRVLKTYATAHNRDTGGAVKALAAAHAREAGAHFVHFSAQLRR